jgi:predicted DnaQ family exonuclease/DinG family helicase
MPDHQPEALAEAFGLSVEGKHKALRDAEILVGTYLHTLEALRGASFTAKQQMLRLLNGTHSDLLPILVALGNEAAKLEVRSAIARGDLDSTSFNAMFNIGGEEAGAQVAGGAPLDVEEIGAMFDPGGLLAQKSPVYEYRPQQTEMARAVASALNNAQLLVAEAGTGVGKSMAYLVPAVLHAVENNVRIVVSTNTKNLQEQLFFKDLPDLETILDTPFRYALLKGRGNYICLNRWDSVLTNLDALLSDEERRAALPLVLWAEQTKTGDISENVAFDLSRSGGLWAKVCSDSGYCRNQRCRNNGRCLAGEARKAAQRAHIVVVNHSLLFSDVASDNAVLGEYRHLVLDEAHNVERTAAHYLGRELSVWRVKNLSDQLCSPGLPDTGTLPALRHWVGTADLEAADLKSFDLAIGTATNAAAEAYERAQAFFQSLTEEMRQGGSSSGAYTEKLRYRPGEPVFDDLRDPLDAFLDAGADLEKSLADLGSWLRGLRENTFPNQDEVCAELEGRREQCQELANDLDYLTDAKEETTVYWMELPTREGSMDTRIFGVPLNVSDVLREALYEQMESIVFTSATLGIRGKLVYFLRRMGLEGLEEDRVSQLCLGSPFDYDQQALVCALPFMPSPKSPGFQEAVDSFLEDLATGVQRGTLALFTSYSMLNRTHSALRTPLKSQGIPLLGQGIDGGRTSITDRFKLEGQAMLLGTDSFWEGIDVPGEALQILGIVRLPFAVPSEPLVAAQMEELEKQGKNSFLHYSVPEAILKFRQGFGRLIRNKTDRGAVVILDSRVLNTRYGRAFLEALPAGHQCFNTQGEAIGAIKDWFEGANGAGGSAS